MKNTEVHINAAAFMIITGIILGLAAGYIMHRSDFCLAGMFRDFFLFRTVFKLRILFLLVICTMAFFETARLTGLLSSYPFPAMASPSMLAPAGGFMFGIGMVLAGGCVVGSLYKMGAGSVPSLVAILGIISGSALYAEIFPWLSSIISQSTVLRGKVTLPQLLGIQPFFLVALIIFASLPYMIRTKRRDGWIRRVYTEGSLQPWKAAILLSVVGLFSYLLIGMPLGITTAYTKCAAYLESTFFRSHFENLDYYRGMPINYLQPLFRVELRGGPGPGLDAISLIQFPLIFGIVAGSALSAILVSEFKLRWKLPLLQYASAATGGVLMGFASRLAAGCNVWHLMGGLPIMAIQSMFFVVGLLPGSWLGARILNRYVIR